MLFTKSTPQMTIICMKAKPAFITEQHTILQILQHWSCSQQYWGIGGNLAIDTLTTDLLQIHDSQLFGFTPLESNFL